MSTKPIDIALMKPNIAPKGKPVKGSNTLWTVKNSEDPSKKKSEPCLINLLQ